MTADTVDVEATSSEAVPTGDVLAENKTGKPLVGIGGCLHGQAVRYNGDSKKANHSIRQLREAVNLKPFCPEVAIGLGVPREPIRLVTDSNKQLHAMDSQSQQRDYTESLQAVADSIVTKHTLLAGYILVKGSPSCGFERVKVYNEKGNGMPSDGVGIFAKRLMDIDPLLPVEEDGRLNDKPLRESFIRRIYAYSDWKQLLADSNGRPRHAQLIDFYSRYKYLVMAHHIDSYKAIGRLLASPDKQNPAQQRQDFIRLLMTALQQRADRKGYSNALSHVKGHLKRQIGSRQRVSLDEIIASYRAGEVPLVVPVTMLNHYFDLYPNEYINKQVLLQDYPAELGLRN